MRLTDITTDQQLRDHMTTPTPGVVESVKNLRGDLLVLGGSGKMGPELIEMILRADAAAGTSRKIVVASTFSNPADRTVELFASLGVQVFKGELTDPAFLGTLPVMPNVIYMPGFKFGSSGNWEKAVHVNCILPYMVGERFPASAIVVFSSANPYAYTTFASGGAREGDALDPKGIYGWSIVARESAFAITARRHPDQRVCYYRLAYAQHLAYGVLVDLARAVMEGNEISVSVPYVNLVSQRDANDRAIRCFELCANPPAALNVCGRPYAVREVAHRLGAMLGKEPRLVGTEPEVSQVINDDLCVQRFGAYLDPVDDLMAAAVGWVQNERTYWGKPTKFGEVRREY
jgi:nucleoside-diphosphate-sugar epimerase